MEVYRGPARMNSRIGRWIVQRLIFQSRSRRGSAAGIPQECFCPIMWASSQRVSVSLKASGIYRIRWKCEAAALAMLEDVGFSCFEGPKDHIRILHSCSKAQDKSGFQKPWFAGS